MGANTFSYVDGNDAANVEWVGTTLGPALDGIKAAPFATHATLELGRGLGLGWDKG